MPEPESKGTKKVFDPLREKTGFTHLAMRKSCNFLPTRSYKLTLLKGLNLSRNTK
jgi:hypothetical protein